MKTPDGLCSTIIALQFPEGHLTPYLPLDSQTEEIRLATLAPGIYDDELVIQLHVEGLFQDIKPEYEALSYAWGSIGTPCVAQVDGMPLPIGENFGCALRHLRYQDRGRVFWIDALCINQADIPERNSQVQLMGPIYYDATAVAVWLGPTNSDNEETIRKIRQSEKQGKFMTLHLGGMEVRTVSRMIRICERPWFSRVWV